MKDMMYSYYVVEAGRVAALNQGSSGTVFVNVPTQVIVRVTNQVEYFNTQSYLDCEVMRRDKTNRIVWERTFLNLNHVYNISPTEDPEAPAPLLSSSQNCEF